MTHHSRSRIGAHRTTLHRTALHRTALGLLLVVGASASTACNGRLSLGDDGMRQISEQEVQVATQHCSDAPQPSICCRGTACFQWIDDPFRACEPGFESRAPQKCETTPEPPQPEPPPPQPPQPPPARPLPAKPHTDGFAVGDFTAEYYNGDKLVASEVVERPTVHYPWSDFHGIRSEDFRGVWKGTVTVTDPLKTIDFNAAYSWADGKLFIDEVEVPWTARTRRSLAAGPHSVRVELDNNWHTTNFNMSFTSNPTYDRASALAMIAPTLTPDTKIIEVNSYESADRYNDLIISLQGAKTPVFVVLASYDAINWTIDAQGADLRGVAYGSNAVGPTVVTSGTVPTYEITDFRYDTPNAESVTGRKADAYKYEYDPAGVTIAVP